jgi:hypothetical protein
MKDLRTALREGDPVGREAGLSPADAARIRRHVLSARTEGTAGSRRVFFACASALLIAVIGGVWLTHVPPPAPPVEASTVRQLQFSTAGGTRVFWTFNPDLNVR